MNLENSIVTSNCGSLTANPADWMLAPFELNPIAESMLAAPFELLGIDVTALDAPNALSSLAVESLSAPLALSSVDATEMAAPNSLLAVVKASPLPPVIIPAQPQSDMTAANSLAPESIATPSAPNELTDLAQTELSAPSVIASQGQSELSAPNTLTALPAEPTDRPFPLNHARILVDNLLIGFGQSMTPASASPALSQNTWDRYNFQSYSGSGEDEVFKVSFGGDIYIDTVCVSLIGASGLTFGVRYTEEGDGTEYPFGDDIVITDSDKIMFHLPVGRFANFLKLVVYGGFQGQSFSVNYFSAGEALQMQRPFFSGHTPINLADRTRYRSNYTDSGELVGREIVSNGQENSITVKNLDQTWVREWFLPFRELAKTNIYFIAWNLRDYPNDVGLCQTTGDIDVSYSGVKDLMQVNWSQIGHGNV